MLINITDVYLLILFFYLFIYLIIKLEFVNIEATRLAYKKREKEMNPDIVYYFFYLYNIYFYQILYFYLYPLINYLRMSIEVKKLLE